MGIERYKYHEGKLSIVGRWKTMLKKLLLSSLVLIIIFITSCENIDLGELDDEDIKIISENLIVCNEPYIRFGTSCCLDQNDNNICDRDEEDYINLDDAEVGSGENMWNPSLQECLTKNDCIEYLKSYTEKNILVDWVRCKDTCQFFGGDASTYTGEKIKGNKSLFKLQDDFIFLQGSIIAVTSEGCNQDYLKSEDLIREDNCQDINNMASCVRIPLSLRTSVDINNNLECEGQKFKPYCQIKMDGNVIKEGCFETGLKAITTYSETSTDISENHMFDICCSADDSRQSFDVCKSFTMGKVCDDETIENKNYCYMYDATPAKCLPRNGDEEPVCIEGTSEYKNTEIRCDVDLDCYKIIELIQNIPEGELEEAIEAEFFKCAESEPEIKES